MSERVDAIVVGAGVTGGIVGAELARAGAKVLCLDKGPHFSDDDFRFKHDEIRYYSRSAIVPKMATDPITWRPNERSTARILPWAVGPLAADEPLHLPPSVGTGGGSIHWGGASWRLREADFRMRSAIVERFGESAIPENTSIVDWPYGYDELEPYYDRAEWELGISGQAGNINGEIVPGGNPFEAPRRRDFPMPPLKRGAADHYFVEAAKRLGYHPFPQPAAIASTDDFAEDRSACVYCGFCHGFPCHVNAKTSTHNTVIPAGLATGNLEIRPFSRVIRVVRSDDGHEVRGVVYLDSSGRLHVAESGLVVLGCYTLENTRLLLVSGITGNGHTGKYFMTHNFGFFTGVLPDYTNPFMGPLTAASVVDDFNAELIPDNELGRRHPADRGRAQHASRRPALGSRVQGVAARQLPQAAQHLRADAIAAVRALLRGPGPERDGSLGPAGPAHDARLGRPRRRSGRGDPAHQAQDRTGDGHDAVVGGDAAAVLSPVDPRGRDAPNGRGPEDLGRRSVR